jgi:hypothetical protein
MYRRRVACRIALRLPRQNACPDAVNAPSVETKVLHLPVHPFPARRPAALLDIGSWWAVSDELRSIAERLAGGARRAGGVPRAYQRRPSRRVAASAPCNTFPFSISGYEREKDMVPE